MLGTRNLLQVLQDQLEAEGVGVATAKEAPPRPVIIEAVRERAAYDILIPITKPSLTHNIRRLSDLDLNELELISDQPELAEPLRIRLRMEFATTEAEVDQVDILTQQLRLSRELLASITTKVIDRTKLPNRFAELYPIVCDCVAERCFGQPVDAERDAVRSHLSRLDLQEGVTGYLARKISELTLERRAIEFERADFRLSKTRPFAWRRNLPPLVAHKTVFNYG